MSSPSLVPEFDDDLFDMSNPTPDLQFQVKYSYQKNKLQKPRRNRSAFIIFSSEARGKLKINEGSLNSNEMMVKLAELWKNLSDEEREKYENLARDDKIRYQQELAEFAKCNPTDTIQNKTKNNHVKKACSAYGIFLKERKEVIKTEQPNLKMADILKIVSNEWKSLAEDKKKTYQDKASLEKEIVKNKLCEALMRERASKEGNAPAEEVRKQLKRNFSEQLPRVPNHYDVSLMKSKSNLTFPQAWPQPDELNQPSSSYPFQPRADKLDNTVKVENPHTVNDKPVQQNFFPHPNMDFMMNPNLFMNQQGNSNEMRLLSFLAQQNQRPDLMLNLLNMRMNGERMQFKVNNEPNNLPHHQQVPQNQFQNGHRIIQRDMALNIRDDYHPTNGYFVQDSNLEKEHF